MILKAIKFITVMAIVAGVLYAFGAIGYDDFYTRYGDGVEFSVTLAKIGRGLLITGGGAVGRFLAGWYEYEQKQKNKNGRR